MTNYIYVYTDVDGELVPFSSLSKARAFANKINTDFKIRRFKVDPTFNEWLDSHVDE